VRLFVRRVRAQHLLQTFDREPVLAERLVQPAYLQQQLEVEHAKLLARTFCPLFVRIAREHIAGVKSERSLISRRIVARAMRLVCVGAEDIDVDADARGKGDTLFRDDHDLLGSDVVYKGGAEVVEVLVEVVRSGGWIQIGPERLGDLLAMERMPRLQRETLEQRLCLPSSPRFVERELIADPDLEAAQEVDGDVPVAVLLCHRHGVHTLAALP
jgi:hypothetical protein